MRARTDSRVRGASQEHIELAREFRRVMTPAERVLWDALRGRQVRGLKFRRQVALGPYILDFCCPEHRLVVEVDGSVHDAPEQRDRDEHRSRQLESFGYRILRVRNEDVLGDLPSVLERICDVVAEVEQG